MLPILHLNLHRFRYYLNESWTRLDCDLWIILVHTMSLKNMGVQWVHENIIIIGDLLETHWRSICVIGDRHPSSKSDMTDRRPTCLIGYPLNIHDQACRSPMGLRQVLESSPIKIIFSWTWIQWWYITCLPHEVFKVSIYFRYRFELKIFPKQLK